MERWTSRLAVITGAVAAAGVLIRLVRPHPGWTVGGLDGVLLVSVLLAAVAIVLGAHVIRREPDAPLRLDDAAYDALFRRNPQPMFVADVRRDRMLDVNEAALAHYGYDRAEFLRLGPSKIRPPEDRERFRSHVEEERSRRQAEVRPRGLLRHGVWRHVRKDGSVILVEPVTQDVEFEGRRAVMVLVNDVTDRHAVEEALRVTGQTLEAVVDASPLALVLLDAEGRVQLWNAAAERMFGWAAEEVLGERSPLLDADATPDYERIRSRVRKGEKLARVTVRRRRRDGSWLDLSLATAAVPSPDGGEPWMLGVFTDITDQLAMEGALRSSEARYRELMEQASDGIFVLDDGGVLLATNGTACEMLDHHPEALAGMDVRRLVAPESMEERPLRFPELRAGKTTVTERTLLRRDGSRLPVEISAKMMSDGRIHAIVRDITERLRLEAELRQSQKMEAVGRLAGGIAHDFNNILTAITGYTQLIAEAVEPGSAAEEDLAQVVRSAERAERLTRQLLAFSRKQVVQPEVLDLNAVIRDMGKLVRRLIGEDITLETHLDPSTGRIRLDPSELEQVLMNLVVNARDAMPGGGRLVIRTRETMLGEHASDCVLPVRAGRHVTISVADTGVGMDESTADSIFEPFFTTKAPGKGTGLGLSTVYGIVKQAGGTIAVRSMPGGGATFSIHLPAVDADARAQRPAPADDPAAGTETILVVEDEDAVRALACRILRRHGYTVAEATDAVSALKVARSADIDLLLTDVIMPGANGGELAARLRKDRPGVPVLYMSGYMADEIGRAGVGTDGAFIQKPFTPAALVRKVREVLDAGGGAESDASYRSSGTSTA